MMDAFARDLAADLEDPEMLREYVKSALRIATVDAVVNALDDARTAAGLSKADLARAAGVQAATIRRLFSSGGMNPTLGTLAEVAAVLGLRISVEPLAAEDLDAVAKSLPSGQVAENAVDRVPELSHAFRKIMAVA